MFGVMLEYEKKNTQHNLIDFPMKWYDFKKYFYFGLYSKKIKDKIFIFVKYVVFKNVGLDFLIQSEKQE